jgi:hypothetical protein
MKGASVRHPTLAQGVAGSGRVAEVEDAIEAVVGMSARWAECYLKR